VTRAVGAEPVCVLTVPEIRDYQRINSELVRRLDAGSAHVRLAGVEGQRLLVSGLAGPWLATVEVEGDAGPELAAWLDAPGLTVVCRGRAADGAGLGLKAGRLIVLGDVGPACGYVMIGGSIVVAGDADPRAGLDQHGGSVVILGSVGRLAAERQTGGFFAARAEAIGPHAGIGRSGGRFVAWSPGATLDPADAEALRQAAAGAEPWLSIDLATLGRRTYTA
jgi:glutamate synthase domain-containing protein 3